MTSASKYAACLLTVLILPTLGVAGPAERKLPAYAPAVPAWTGTYFGGHAGYAFGRTTLSSSMADDTQGYFEEYALSGLAAAGAPATFNPNSLTGGIQAGHNWQSNRIVYGFEGDFSLWSLKSSRFSHALDSIGGDRKIAQDSQSNWLATLRARLGYTFDKVLIYGTGGLALTHQSTSMTYLNINTSLPEGGTSSVSETKFGLALGAGTEYRFSQLWSFKAEYLYAHFGDTGLNHRINSTNFIGSYATFANAADLSAHIVRAGINYHF